MKYKSMLFLIVLVFTFITMSNPLIAGKLFNEEFEGDPGDNVGTLGWTGDTSLFLIDNHLVSNQNSAKVSSQPGWRTICKKLPDGIYRLTPDDTLIFTAAFDTTNTLTKLNFTLADSSGNRMQMFRDSYLGTIGLYGDGQPGQSISSSLNTGFLKMEVSCSRVKLYYSTMAAPGDWQFVTEYPVGMDNVEEVRIQRYAYNTNPEYFDSINLDVIPSEKRNLFTAEFEGTSGNSVSTLGWTGDTSLFLIDSYQVNYQNSVKVSAPAGWRAISQNLPDGTYTLAPNDTLVFTAAFNTTDTLTKLNFTLADSGGNRMQMFRDTYLGTIGLYGDGQSVQSIPSSLDIGHLKMEVTRASVKFYYSTEANPEDWQEVADFQTGMDNVKSIAVQRYAYNTNPEYFDSLKLDVIPSPAGMRRDGTVMRYGKPYFPFGFYYVAYRYDETYPGDEYTRTDMIDILTTSNPAFNCIATDPGTSGYDLSECLDNLNIYGMDVFLMSIAGAAFNVDVDMIAGVNAYKNNKCIIGWQLGDDVNAIISGNPLWSPAQIETRHNLCKANDPKHITYVSGKGIDDMPALYLSPADYMGKVDLFGVQAYGVAASSFLSWTHDRFTCGTDASDNNVPANKNKTGIIANIQTFKKPGTDYRRPTPAEERNMSYAGIIAGCKGVIAYTFFDMFNNFDHPKELDMMQSLREEAATLEDVIMDGVFFKNVSTGSACRASLWLYDNQVYIIIMNPNLYSYSTPLAVDIQLPGYLVSDTLANVFPYRSAGTGFAISNGHLTGYPDAANAATIFEEEFFGTCGNNLSTLGWSGDTSSFLIDDHPVSFTKSVKVSAPSGWLTVTKALPGGNYILTTNDTLIFTAAFDTTDTLTKLNFTLADSSGNRMQMFRDTYLGTIGLYGDSQSAQSIPSSLDTGYLKMEVTRSTVKVYYSTADEPENWLYAAAYQTGMDNVQEVRVQRYAYNTNPEYFDSLKLELHSTALPETAGGIHVFSTDLTPLLNNGGFESGMTGWNISGANICSSENGNAKKGSAYGVQYKSSSAYTASTWQTKTNLSNGNYVLTAWVRSSGGQNSCYMKVSDYDSQSSCMSADIPAEQIWTPIEIRNIPVSNGQIKVTFYSDAAARQWLNFDFVQLYKQP